MSDETDEARNERRAAIAQKKADAAAEGAEAWAEHLAEADAVLAKTEKLRALRLARETEAEKAKAAQPAKPSKSAKSIKTTKSVKATKTIKTTKPAPRDKAQVPKAAGDTKA